MELLRIQDACLSYGLDPLLDHTTLSIHQQDRIAVVGRNGAGKSTLLKVLRGITDLDSGQVQRIQHIKVSYLEQDPPQVDNLTVFDYVATALGEHQTLLSTYYQLSQQLSQEHNEQHLQQLAELQTQLEHHGIWQLDAQIHSVLSDLQLIPHMLLSDLSGGWLRRAALAKALVTLPDVLLLDEPTNHLDLDAIQWLEQFLLNFSGAIIFISHDRYFIDRLATKIIELDRGQLSTHLGNYQQFLAAKAEAEIIEQQQQSKFDKKLAAEETWIRQGIKARRTRDQGRVRALQQLRQTRAARIDRQGQVNFSIEQAYRSGKLVFDAKNISFGYADQPLVQQFSTLVLRGDRIGLIGPNGVGKTTLIKLLLGQIEGYQGKLKQGVNLEVAYFDQHRFQLDLNASVQDNVADGKQDIIINGHSRHVLGYLQDFLFTPQRARTPVKALSGGEKNRLLLAKLFLQPSNVLILDEPTNDLDLETLELLEEILAQYAGTVLIVSHDRSFLNQTVSSIWAFTGQGKIVDLVGGYDDYIHWQKQQQSTTKKPEAQTKPKATKPRKTEKSLKLSYNEQRLLAELPQQIEKLETLIEELQQQINHQDFFKQEASTTQPQLDQLNDYETQLTKAYEQWEKLEEKQDQATP